MREGQIELLLGIEPSEKSDLFFSLQKYGVGIYFLYFVIFGIIRAIRLLRAFKGDFFGCLLGTKNIKGGNFSFGVFNKVGEEQGDSHPFDPNEGGPGFAFGWEIFLLVGIIEGLVDPGFKFVVIKIKFKRYFS